MLECFRVVVVVQTNKQQIGSSTHILQPSPQAKHDRRLLNAHENNKINKNQSIHLIHTNNKIFFLSALITTSSVVI